ncbi:MAG TPA: RCC1 repeat-containing protein, partial [Myxococcales bacterium]
MRATLKPARSAILSALAFVAFSTVSSPNALAQAPGSAEAWGYNFFGQLGDGTPTQRLTPVAVTGLDNAIGIAGGYGHSLAVLGDGTVMAWGRNSFGQLGDGTTFDRLTP